MAQKIMGENLIGPEDIHSIKVMQFHLPEVIPSIPFSADYLKSRKDDYYLLLGVQQYDDGIPVTIRNLVKVFGKDPALKEPCFYNQDWYEKEAFIDTVLNEGWFMIRKNVYDESRGAQPEELISRYSFPSAISCCFAFFTAWLCRDTKLWYHDYVWCIDTDHNGDRVYVGKYHDVDGVNKNGFSIHRHLALRDCYGCID